MVGMGMGMGMGTGGKCVRGEAWGQRGLDSVHCGMNTHTHTHTHTHTRGLALPNTTLHALTPVKKEGPNTEIVSSGQAEHGRLFRLIATVLPQ